MAKTQIKVQAIGPCTQWNHHKFEPTRTELVELQHDGFSESEQTCKFCKKTRKVTFETQGDLNESDS